MFQTFQFPSPVTSEIPLSLWPGSPLPLPLLLPLPRPRSRIQPIPPQWTLMVTARLTSSRTWSPKLWPRPLHFSSRPRPRVTRGGRRKSTRRRKTRGRETSAPPCRPTKPSWRSLWRRDPSLTVSPSYSLLLIPCVQLPRSNTTRWRSCSLT